MRASIILKNAGESKNGLYLKRVAYKKKNMTEIKKTYDTNAARFCCRYKFLFQSRFSVNSTCIFADSPALFKMTLTSTFGPLYDSSNFEHTAMAMTDTNLYLYVFACSLNGEHVWNAMQILYVRELLLFELALAAGLLRPLFKYKLDRLWPFNKALKRNRPRRQQATQFNV